MNTCTLIIGLFLGGLIPAQAQPPAVPPNVDPVVVDGYKDEIQQQYEWLTAAYDLDQNAQGLLWQELERRMNDQFSYDSVIAAQEADWLKRYEAASPEPDTPEDAAFAAEFEQIYSRMPLAPYEVASWVEGQVPPPVATEGRVRYQEIRERQEMRLDERYAYAEWLGSAKKEITDEKKTMTTPVAPGDSKPMPQGPQGQEAAVYHAEQQQQQVVQPAQNLAPSPPQTPKPPPKIEPSKPLPTRPQLAVPPKAETSHAAASPTPTAPKKEASPKVEPLPTKPADKPAQPPAAQLKTPAGPDKPKAEEAVVISPPPPAPPLDEWDKHVIATAEKYKFTDAQVTNARGILADLRSRARQYRLSHANDFAKAESMSDAKARAERLKQLNGTLDALFAELKVRLESLPTLEQKQKAETPSQKKPGADSPAAKPSPPAPSPKSTPPAPSKPSEPKKGK